MLPSRLLPLALAALAMAQGAAQESAPASRPLVDPALVGAWRGITGHGFTYFTWEIRSGGTVRETVTSGDSPDYLSVFMLRAVDGKWALRNGSSGSYQVKNPNRVEWLYDSGPYKSMRLDRRSGATTRPTTRPRLITPQELDTIPELIALSKDPEPEYRELAISHLGAREHSSPEEANAALQTLVAGLSDPAPGVAALAAHVIGSFGPAAKSASKPLIDSMRSSDRELRLQAAHALGQVTPDAGTAVPALAALLADSDDSVRVVAVQSLGAFDEKAAAILGKALRDPANSVIRAALGAIEKMKRAGAPAVPALVELLGEGDEDQRGRAIDAIQAIGVAGRPAVPELLRALDGEDEIAIRAARALSAYPEDAEASVPAILKLLGHTKDSFWRGSRRRVEIIQALGAFDSAAASALPTLKKLDEDKSPDVRRAAAHAQRRISRN